MYRIVIAPRSKRELKKISKLYRKAIAEAIDELMQDPYLGKPLMRELTGRYSYKIGVYRIIYRVSEREKTVYIITVGHRSVVYE